MSLTTIQTKILETLQNAITADEALSLRDIAERIGVKSANAVLYQVRKLEKIGNIMRDNNGKVIGVSMPNSSNALAFLPLLGNAACGLPFEQIEQERMIPAPLGFFRRSLSSKLYIVKAVGNSMSPKIQDGDYIVFEKDLDPTNGSVVVARTRQGFTVKVFKERKDELILEPINKDYRPLVFPKKGSKDDFVIDGVAVGVFKPQENLSIY